MANQPQQLLVSVVRRLPDAATALPLLKGGFDGAGAAVGGLALVFAPVYLLWIFSPDLSGGTGSVLRTATCLWLYGHGAALWRTGIDGGSVPVDVTPLLLTAVFAALLRRAAVRADAGGTAPLAAALAPAAGYLAVGLPALAVWVTGTQGGLSVHGPAGLAWLVAWVAVLVGGPQLRRLRGPLLDRVAGRDWYRRIAGGGRAETYAGCLRDAVRAACAGTLALLGAGAAVWLVAVLAHLGGGGRIAGQLAPDLSGRLALLLLCALFAPNAAVAGASAAVGSGFQVPGGGLIAFPLLGAVPGGKVDGSGGLALELGPDLGAGLGFVLGPATLAALAGGVVVGLFARRTGRLRAALATALLAAAGVGLLAGIGAWAAGGALGVSALAWVGPAPVATGVCAAMWTALAGVPATVVARGGLRALDPSGLLRRDLWTGTGAGAGAVAGPGTAAAAGTYETTETTETEARAGERTEAGTGPAARFGLRFGDRLWPAPGFGSGFRLGRGRRLTWRQKRGEPEAVGGATATAAAVAARNGKRRSVGGFDPTLGGALGDELVEELGGALDDEDGEAPPPLPDERTSRLGGWRTALRDQAWRLGSRTRR